MKIQHSKYLLLFFSIVFFLFFYFYLNFDGLYGQDAYEYLRYSKALKNYALTGQNPGDYFWPLYYPVFGALFSFIIKNVGLALVLISVFSLSISAFYLYKILKLLFPNTKLKSIYVFTFFMLSPILFKSSLLVMSDMLTVCFVVLTIYNYLKFKELNLIKYFYFIAVFSVLAFLTRYASAVVLLPFVVGTMFLFFNRKVSLLHLIFTSLIIAFLFLPHVLIRYENTTEFLSHQWIKDWGFLNIFKRNFSTIDGISLNKLPNLVFVFSNFYHPRYFFAGIVFLPILFWKFIKQKNTLTLKISVVLYALFLAGIPFQNSRFLVLTFPLIIVILFPVFNYLTNLKIFKKLIYIGIGLTILLQFILINKAFKTVLERNRFEIKMAELLKPYQQNNLYSFDIDIALKGRNLDFNYQNLWYKRYYNLKKDDLILFHPTQFSKQWHGRNPILNYNYFKENYKLKVIEELPKGWKLYKVE